MRAIATYWNHIHNLLDFSDISRAVVKTEPPSEDFGARLFGHRRAAGLSQAELARRAHLSRSFLSEIENGRRPPPPQRTVERLTSALALPDDQRDALCALATSGRPCRDALEATRAVLALVADLSIYGHQLRARDVERVRRQIKELIT